MAEHIFVFHIPGSQYNNLYRILAQFIHHIVHQIKSLLVCKAGYHTDQHDVGVLIQAQFLLKRHLIDRLIFSEILNAEVLCDPPVRLRIPVVIIQAVYDTAQIVGSGSHKSVQAFPVKRRLDLFCVAVAHSGNFIRINNTAL